MLETLFLDTFDLELVWAEVGPLKVSLEPFRAPKIPPYTNFKYICPRNWYRERFWGPKRVN